MPVVPVFEEVVAAVLLAFESVLLSDLESVLESDVYKRQALVYEHQQQRPRPVRL